MSDDDHAARAHNPEKEWLMAIADSLLVILAADRRAHLGQPLTLCPGCSTAHWGPGALCDTCTVARPA